MELIRLKIKKPPYPRPLKKKKKKFLFFGEWNFLASSPKKEKLSYISLKKVLLTFRNDG